LRVLLDECLPRRFGAALQGHVVTTVPQAGWAGLTNGALLPLAPLVLAALERTGPGQAEVALLEIRGH
jgi:hypothetical protein